MPNSSISLSASLIMEKSNIFAQIDFVLRWKVNKRYGSYLKLQWFWLSKAICCVCLFPIMAFVWLIELGGWGCKGVVHSFFWFPNDFAVPSPDKRKTSCRGNYQMNCFLKTSVDRCALYSMGYVRKKSFILSTLCSTGQQKTEHTQVCLSILNRTLYWLLFIFCDSTLTLNSSCKRKLFSMFSQD